MKRQAGPSKGPKTRAAKPAAPSRPAKSALTHLDARGAMHMVDVGDKPATRRWAIARARLRLGQKTRAALAPGKTTAKGDVFAAARVAGIQAAKRTSELIPLCHALPLSHVAIDMQRTPRGIDITARAETVAPTGVEMEALTAAAVAALTLYDMLKAMERGIVIESVALLEKGGGRSGLWQRSTDSTE